MMNLKSLLSFVAMIVFTCQISYGEIVKRAAFDIGSGKIKVLVAEFDTDTNTIVKPLFSDSRIVVFSQDLAKSSDERFSQEIIEKGVETLQDFKAKAEALGVTEFRAIATAAFRKAKNSHEALNTMESKTGIPIELISQNEEGILGFLSVLQVTGYDPQNTICYDTGGGSFQITGKQDDQFFVYQGKLGQVPMKELILDLQWGEGHDQISPNPVSSVIGDFALQKVEEILQRDDLTDVKKMVQGKKVVGIGFQPRYILKEGKPFTFKDVEEAIAQRIGLDDKAIFELDAVLYPEEERNNIVLFSIPHLIMAQGIMKTFGIDQVEVVRTGGNAFGLLLSPKYWSHAHHVTLKVLDTIGLAPIIVQNVKS